MSALNSLKESIKKVLPELEVVIGWEEGFDALHAAPVFIKTEEDLERLIIGPTAVQSLATYLPSYKGKKVGVVVKGCDSRAVIQLLQEKLINRDDVTIFGYGCDGVVSMRRLADEIGEIAFVQGIEKKADKVVLTLEEGNKEVAFKDVCASKCATCAYPNAIECDHFAGAELEAKPFGEKGKAVEEFEAMPVEERFKFWQDQMSRCIRCYACRNACPMCVCRDHCIATSRDPHWVSQETAVSENFMFQMIHVMHLAGRCVECGECERACPMDIPIGLLRSKMAGIVNDVFSYASGVSADDVPPLMTFTVDEETIKERSW